VLRPENKRSKLAAGQALQTILTARFECANNPRAAPSITSRERPELT
jgi:hypothetical protein